MIATALAALADTLWGPFSIALLAFAGILFSCGTGWFLLRHPFFPLREAWRSLFSHPDSPQKISPFEALCTALAGTLGTGNMAGTAAAIALGGPGAVFWMMVCALLGMATKAAECTLAVLYRQTLPDGSYTGGAMYYMKDGIGGIFQPIAFLFAGAMALSALGTTAVQPYTMADSVETAFHIPRGVTIALSAVLCTYVLFRGKKGITRFCTRMTPALCLLYVLGALIALFLHRAQLPAALASILQEAFLPSAAAGGTAGYTLRCVIAQGFSKSTFTHEAGMGSAAMIHAAANVKHPAAQGMLGAAEVFIDTPVICLLTALVILTAGPDVSLAGEPGIGLTMAAFRTSLGVWGDRLIAVCCVLFAFSTMVSWSFEFETSMRYLLGEKPRLYRTLYALSPVLTVFFDARSIWNLVDVCTGLVVIPNVLALVLLSGRFFPLFTAYCRTALSAKKRR